MNQVEAILYLRTLATINQLQKEHRDKKFVNVVPDEEMRKALNVVFSALLEEGGLPELVYGKTVDVRDRYQLYLWSISELMLMFEMFAERKTHSLPKQKDILDNIRYFDDLTRAA